MFTAHMIYLLAFSLGLFFTGVRFSQNRYFSRFNIPHSFLVLNSSNARYYVQITDELPSAAFFCMECCEILLTVLNNDPHMDPSTTWPHYCKDAGPRQQTLSVKQLQCPT